MTAELSQPTLGLLRRILEGMEHAYAVALPDRKKFWKDRLFDFGFPSKVIEIAVSYGFRWGDIISDLFIGKFGPQNQHFADALPPYFCEQTLKRLLALAVHEATDLVLIEQLAESLKRDGVEVTWTEKPTAQTTEAQTSGTVWLSETQREILKTAVSQFLKTNEPTSRILLVKKLVDPDIVDELTPVLLRNPTVEKLFPTALAFQCCGDKKALDAAKSAVQLVIRTLQKLFASTGEKVHFPIDEIEEQARLILNTQRPELGSTEDRAAVQLGLYLVQDFRRVHSGMGGVYPNISHVVVNERIGSTNAATAWNEHIEQYNPYLKNRGEKRPVSNENMKLSAENPVAKTEAVASERNKPMEPFKLITEAIRAVPAVKYALGIGGVIGVIAIVKSFGIDYRVAVFGVVIMLVLMTVLVIFAKLTAKRESVFHWPAIIFTWFALILIIATAIALFTSVFWGRPLELRYKGPSSGTGQTNATSQGDPSTSGKSSPTSTAAASPQPPQRRPDQGELETVPANEKPFSQRVKCESHLADILCSGERLFIVRDMTVMLESIGTEDNGKPFVFAKASVGGHMYGSRLHVGEMISLRSPECSSFNVIIGGIDKATSRPGTSRTQVFRIDLVLQGRCK
jgi:hypothetical protein